MRRLVLIGTQIFGVGGAHKGGNSSGVAEDGKVDVVVTELNQHEPGAKCGEPLRMNGMFLAPLVTYC